MITNSYGYWFCPFFFKGGVDRQLLFAYRNVSIIDLATHAIFFMLNFKIQTVDFGAGGNVAFLS